MGVEPKIMGKPPKSSILIGFSIIKKNTFWGTPIFGNTHMALFLYRHPVIPPEVNGV